MRRLWLSSNLIVDKLLNLRCSIVDILGMIVTKTPPEPFARAELTKNIFHKQAYSHNTDVSQNTLEALDICLTNSLLLLLRNHKWGRNILDGTTGGVPKIGGTQPDQEMLITQLSAKRFCLKHNGFEFFSSLFYLAWFQAL